MLHRIKEHPDRVKQCRDQENCTRKSCWYQHNTVKNIEAPSEVDNTNNDWVNDELDTEKEDFQEDTILPKPPVNL